MDQKYQKKKKKMQAAEKDTISPKIKKNITKDLEVQKIYGNQY